jgi:hypothetical protein
MEAAPEPATKDDPSHVTFNKDVLRVLQENCLECHRPGGIAPMSLMTYANARPWAKAIKTAVMKKQMPPWFAESAASSDIEFRNAPKMTPEDRNLLAAWADSGALEGDAADVPAASRQWVGSGSEGWRTQPDIVVSMPAAHPVAAQGEGEVRVFSIPNPFKEDTWVTSIEIRPGNPSVVHHAIVQVPKPPAPVKPPEGPQGLRDLPDNESDLLAYLTQLAQLRGGDGAVTVSIGHGGGTFTVNTGHGDGLVRNGGAYSGGPNALSFIERQTGRGAFTTMEAIYAPGSQPMDFQYTDSAKLIPAGSPIRLEVHYTPNGTPTSDTTKVGFTLAKSPAKRSFVIMAPEHLVDTRKPIPAGAASLETTGELTFEQDADLVWFMPHMHLRGKDMTYRLIHPDGREQTVLQANFNFNWQLGYELAKPIKVTKGTRMIVTAHHDNSANNRSNPAPNVIVRWGEMTNEEMMLPWFGVVVDVDALPETIATYKPGELK